MHPTNIGFLLWLRHPRKGLPYLITTTFFMLATLLFMHFYIANFVLERENNNMVKKQKPVLKGIHRKIFEKEESKAEVVMRIDELNMIKTSVNRELMGLEKKRQILLEDISNYNLNIENLKLSYENENNDIERVKMKRLNIELELDEMRHNNQPQLDVPIINETPSEPPPKGLVHSPEHCTMTTCFDLSRCSLFGHFPIYVYPTSHISSFSKSLLTHLLSCQYITTSPNKACLYVYFIEDDITLISDLNKRLTSLMYWNTGTAYAGINHLIINAKQHSIYTLKQSNSHKKIAIGKAMIAQQSFTVNEFRRHFDLVLPPFDEISRLEKDLSLLPMMVPVKRKYLMTFRGKDSHTEHHKNNKYFKKLKSVLSYMQNQYPTDNFIFNFDCKTSHKAIKTSSHNKDFDTCTEHLNQSTFSLITVRSHFSDTQDYSISTLEMLTRLISSLRSGAVPVLLCHPHSMVLPLEDLIDWQGAVVWLPASRTTELHFYIRSFIDADIFEMRRRGRTIYQRFFSSFSTSVHNLLHSLRSRLQIPPPPVKQTPTHSYFNQSYPLLDEVPSNLLDNDEVLGPLEPPLNSTNYLRNFSMAFLKMPSSPNLLDISHIHSSNPFDPPLPFDAKFIGSSYGFRPIGEGWGGAGKEFSEALGGDHAREQFTIVILTYEREAVLMGALARFKGLPHLNKIIIVWNSPKPPTLDVKWPDVGVEVEALKMEVNSLNNRFLPFSSINTHAVLSLDDDVHLRHDEIVFAFRIWRQNRDQIVGFPGRFVSYDKVHNKFFYNSNYSCEMSMVLTGAAFIHKYYLHAYTHLMPGAIRQQVDTFLNCEDIAMNFLVSHISRKPPIKVTSRWTFKCPGCPSALYTDESHFEERHHCINAFTSIYGYLPLLTTQFRADSILFKTKIPHDKQKCFKYV